MKTSSAKQKGRKLQQWVRDEIIKVFPELTLSDVRSTSMGASGEDVLLSPKARAKFPFSVECKAHAAFSIYTHYEQALSNSTMEAAPLLIIRGNNKKPLAVVDAKYFINIIGLLESERRE